jgi:hypothetical protein
MLFALIIWLIAFCATGYAPKKKKILTVEFALHKGQRRIHRSKKRFRVVACGRRFGKTLLAVFELLEFALTHPNSNCAWVAPYFRQSKIVYRFIRKVFHKTGKHFIVYKSDTDLRFEFANGSVIQFFSAENYETMRGEPYDFVVIDEAADSLRDSKLWTDAIRPALADRRGNALFIGTPKGRNLFFLLFSRGKDPEYPDWESFHARTADNPYIARAEIEAARKELPEDTVRQEYDAEFLEESAGVFRRIAAILEGTLDPDYQPRYGHRYVVGWDPAKYSDYSVLFVFDLNTSSVVWFDRFNQFDYSYQVKRVAAVAKRFHNAFILMDSTGVGDVVLERLREHYNNCDGYLLTNPSKKMLIEALQLAIQDVAFKMPDIEVVMAELKQFERRMTPSRNVIYSAPDGAHDDCVIALALVWHAFQMCSTQELDAETASALLNYIGY